jgi:hypothetical protein
MGVPNTLLELKTRAPVQSWAVPICEKTHLTQNTNISPNLTNNEIRRWFNGERINLEKKRNGAGSTFERKAPITPKFFFCTYFNISISKSLKSMTKSSHF